MRKVKDIHNNHRAGSGNVVEQGGGVTPQPLVSPFKYYKFRLLEHVREFFFLYSSIASLYTLIPSVLARSLFRALHWASAPSEVTPRWLTPTYLLVRLNHSCPMSRACLSLRGTIRARNGLSLLVKQISKSNYTNRYSQLSSRRQPRHTLQLWYDLLPGRWIDRRKDVKNGKHVGDCQPCSCIC